MKRPLMTAALALAWSACNASAPTPPAETVPPAATATPPPLGEEIKEAARAEAEDLKEKIEDNIEHKIEDAVEEKIERKVEQTVEAARAFVLDEFLDALAREHQASTGEALDWRHSVVDLFKTLGFDSSLPARRERAQAFAYPRRYRGTARDNVWLRARVIAWLTGE
jgi:hypothetical protein